RLLKNQLASFAEYEREKIIMRTSRGRRRKGQMGNIVGAGPAPTGYQYLLNEHGKAHALAEDPGTAAVIRRLFALAPRMSTADIAATLNAEGVPSPRGKRWWPNVVTQIITNPVYCGLALYGRTSRRPDPDAPGSATVSAAPALVDRATWDAA